VVKESQARRVKKRHADRLLSIQGVCGVGVEKDASGEFVLVVHLVEGAAPALPEEIEGCPVRVVTSGPFRKLARREPQ
jgi:hypothetical protein